LSVSYISFYYPFGVRIVNERAFYIQFDEFFLGCVFLHW